MRPSVSAVQRGSAEKARANKRESLRATIGAWPGCATGFAAFRRSREASPIEHRCCVVSIALKLIGVKPKWGHTRGANVKNDSLFRSRVGDLEVTPAHSGRTKHGVESMPLHSRSGQRAHETITQHSP